MATEDKLWIPPLSPKDQKRLTRLRSDGLLQRIYKWTGFDGKTLWDWLQLLGILAIPLVVAGATLYFTQQQALLSDTASKQQHQIDIQLANDQQKEATLTSYLNDMSDLLLNHNLDNSKSGDAVRQVARERTLTTLRRLDANRNRIVLQFLRDAHLIGAKDVVIDLSTANLSNDDLNFANLSGVNLSGASLSGANLLLADLSGANLTGADLTGATVTKEQLAQAKSLKGATMPDGSIHP